MKTIVSKILYTGILTCTVCAIAACSDDKYDGDPSKDWDGTTTYLESSDDNGFQTYYNPAIGRCGDPMPFYDQKAKEFKVLYLQEYENNGANYHPYWGVSTRDCANYTSLNEVLPTGTNSSQQDAVLGTGCAFYNEEDGLYYIYYTAFNMLLSNREVIMRATSSDFKTWRKDPSWVLKGADYGYSAIDFRDPQVFKADDGMWHMVISSNLKFADFKSSNLRDWEHVGSFDMVWDRMCECPDVFEMNGKWYMIYSEAISWSRKVKYMVADSWDNLKKRFSSKSPTFPSDGREGILDSRAYYAGKTASDGTDRFIWGWCPIRPNGTNAERNVEVGADGEPLWAGALVCHRIVQHEDGTLTLGEVPNIKAKYNKAKEVKVMQQNGFVNGTLSGDGAYVMYNRLGRCNHISFTVTTTEKFGVSLVRSSDAPTYYTMVVNPEDNGSNRKINFEEEGPKGKGFIASVDSYKFKTPGDNTYKVDIYTDNSVVVMYINDNVCYTQRIYGVNKNCWSINGYGGDVTISNVAVSQQ